MLAHALLALLLPLSEAAEGTCRLSTAPGRCWSPSDLEGKVFTVPRQVSRIEPAALRLCPPVADPLEVSLGIVLPVVPAASGLSDTAFEGILGSIGEYTANYPTSNVSLALPGAFRPDPANLVAVPGDSTHRARFDAANAPHLNLSNALMASLSHTRLLLHGSFFTGVPARRNPILVVFVIGTPANWASSLDNGLTTTQALLPDDTSWRIGPTRGQVHVVHLSLAADPASATFLTSVSGNRGVETHQLVGPSAWSVDSLLRSFYGRIRPPAPTLRQMEITNLGPNVVSKAYGGLGGRDTARILLDSALPLAEGLNSLRMLRKVTDGPYTSFQTTSFFLDASAPAREPGPTDTLVSWTCPGPSVLRLAKVPDREEPRADLVLKTLAPGLSHLRLDLSDSATGTSASVHLEGSGDTSWTGDIHTPIDAPTARFSTSSRGDRLVSRWVHPRDPRDTARDTTRTPAAVHGWIQVSSPALPWPGSVLGLQVWTPDATGDTLRVQVRCGEGLAARTVALVRSGEVWTGSTAVGTGKRPYPEGPIVLCPEPKAGGPLPSVTVVVSAQLQRSIPMVDRPVASGAPTCAVRMRPGACVDPATVPPAGWSLPSNTTHADFRRLVVCLPSSAIPAPARIVWVMDNSGSMTGNDPSNLRFKALQWGISRQAELNPQSRAAIVRFSSAATTVLPMTTLDASGLATALDAAQPRPVEALTNWEGAIDLAMSQFEEADNGQPMAIVLLTDGMPNFGTWERAVRPGMPPIYSIYIGDLGQPTTELRDLVALARGRTWMLGSRPDSNLVKGAVRSITGLFTTSPDLFRASLINPATVQASTYREFSQSGMGGPVVATSEKVLALAGDVPNPLRFSYLTQDAPDTSREIAWTFTPDAPPSQAGMEVVGSPFVLSCQVPGALRFLDSAGRAVDWLPSQETNFGIDLEPARLLRTAAIATVRSDETKDFGNVDLPELFADGNPVRRHQGAGTLVSAPRPGSIAVDTLGDTLVARWCDDRVPRDCIEGRLALVRVASVPVVRLLDPDPRGPAGALRVEVVADPLTRDSLPVLLRGGVRESLLVLAVRGTDGVHRALAPYRQGTVAKTRDTLSLARPALGAGSRVVAVVVTGPDTARDTSTIKRPSDSLFLDPGAVPGTIVVHLVTTGRSPAGRVVRLTGPAGTDSVKLDADGRGVVDAGSLVGAATDSSRIVGRALDPVYLDTLRDTTKVPTLPSTSVRFLDPDPTGPIGSIVLEARATGTADSLPVKVSWKSDSAFVVLVRRPDGVYAGRFPFSQAPGNGSDSLRLNPARLVELVATVPGSGRRTASRDTANLTTTPENWTVRGLDSGLVEVSSSSATGIPARILVVTESVSKVVSTRRVDGRDVGVVRTWELLPESRDSATVRIARIDPVFGDTSWKSVLVASPWNASSLRATPDTVDPRTGDSLTLEVRDRDPDPLVRDSVVVRGDNGRTWILRETTPTSGIFTSRIPSRDLDPDWARHPSRTPWTVDLTTTDPNHPADSAQTTATLRNSPVPAETTTVQLGSDTPDGAAGRLRVEVESPIGSDTLQVEITWEGNGRHVLEMVRDTNGKFVAEVPFARWTGAGSDTLRLPSKRTLALAVQVLPDSTRLSSRDSLTLGSRTLRMSLEEKDTLQWRALVRGAEGSGSFLQVRLPDSSWTVPLLRGPSADSALVDLRGRLRESTDSVEVVFLLVDAVYGDTLREVRRLASPWHPATFTAAPDSLDPRAGDSRTLKVEDRDPDPSLLDSVTVRADDGRTWTLVESSPISGVFATRISARDLDPDWNDHPSRTPWTVSLQYTDPDHPADTARETLVLRMAPLPAESTSVRITSPSPDAAAGTLRIQVESPLGSDTLRVELAWDGEGRRELEMVRDSLGRFVVEMAFARWSGDGPDTLRLPSMRNLGISARVLPDSTRRSSRDSLTLSSRSLVLEIDEGDSSRWRATVRGAEGQIPVLTVRLPKTSLTVPLLRGPGLDSAWLDLRPLLPESRDSLDVEFLLVDAVYHDTLRTVRRVAATWTSATLTATPDTLDIVAGGKVLLVVRDRDPHPDRLDTAVVRSSSGHWFVLVETSPTSGVYTLEIRSWDLEQGWAERDPGTRKIVELRYADPRDSSDTARTDIVLARGEAPIQVLTTQALLPVAEVGSDKPSLNLVESSDDARVLQGIAITTWKPIVAQVFVYDRVGVWVTSGDFRLVPDPQRGRNRFVVAWNGCDSRGVPVGNGLYPVRVVILSEAGRLLSNQAFTLGRK